MPSLILMLGVVLVCGCLRVQTDTDRTVMAERSVMAKSTSFFGLGSREHLVAGTTLRVQLLEPLSSETAEAGDSWSGLIQAPVVVDGDEVIAAGSSVDGVITIAVPAQYGAGDRAMLEIELRKVTIDGRETRFRATAKPVRVDSQAGEAVAHRDQVLLPQGSVMTFMVDREVRVN